MIITKICRQSKAALFNRFQHLSKPHEKIFWVLHWWGLNSRNQNRLVVSERHRERVYKRTAEANVTCFGNGGARERADDAFLCHRHKKASEQSGLCSDVSKDYKKDIFVSLLYRFELSQRKLQYKTPEQKERKYALKNTGL